VSPGGTLVAQLAERAVAAPAAAGAHHRRLAAHHLLDALGCLAAGVSHPVPVRLRALQALDGDGGSASTPGRAACSVADAVAHEAVAVHVDEFDALHVAGAVAPACVVVPAALVLADQLDASGARLLDAVIAGCDAVVEAGLRFGGPALYSRRWWPTALFGALGSAAAAAVLLELDEATTRSALALAAADLGGPLAAGLLADGHYLLPGRAAAAGLAAARGAALGMRADESLLDTALPVLLGREVLAASPSAAPHLVRASFKRYPFARPLSAVLAALDALALDGCRTEEATSVEVGLPAPLLAFVTATTTPGGPADAAASAAVAWQAHAEGRSRDVAFVRAAAAVRGPQVTLVADDGLSRLLPERWGAEVAVTVRGRRHSARIEVAPGDPGAELSADELHGKFRHNLGGADGAAAELLLGTCVAVDSLERARDLRAALLRAVPVEAASRRTECVLARADTGRL
jgi:2-methylcitrate dehydratase PrpD